MALLLLFALASTTQPPNRPSTNAALSRAAADPAYRAAMHAAQQQRFHDALKLFEQLATAQPDSAVGILAHYQIGYCYLALNQKQQALAAFQQFVNSHPHTPLTAPAQEQMRQLAPPATSHTPTPPHGRIAVPPPCSPSVSVSVSRRRKRNSRV